MEGLQRSWLERSDEEEPQEEAPVLDTEIIDDEDIYVASYSQLMWWRFRKHRMAVISGVLVVILYTIAAFAEFVAPYDPEQSFVKYKFVPPMKIRIIDAEGNLRRPFVYKIIREKDPETLRNIYKEDETAIYPIRFLVRGTEYELWGQFPTSWHLYGLDVPHEEQGILLLGADRLGRDLFSRLCYGARISLTIGLVSVVLSLVIGILLGGISGFYGGSIDNAIQRLIEFIRSIPEIPLIMALAAALPADWPVVRLYFGVTILLSFVGWTGLARVVRGRFLSMREEDFVMAARFCGSGEMRIILRQHGSLLPQPHHRILDFSDSRHYPVRNWT